MAPQTPLVRLRRATASDVSAIQAIEDESFVNPAEKFDRRRIRALIQNPRATVIVAARSGKVLAWAAGLIGRRGRLKSGRIYAIAVHPEARGMRLGMRLMRRIIAELRAQRARRISLEVKVGNRAAITLYRKLGFIPTKQIEHYYGRGLHAHRMIKAAARSGMIKSCNSPRC